MSFKDKQLKLYERILETIKYNNFVVLRSTVPGTSDVLKVYFMPEFLTEKNYEYDFINNKDWIIYGLRGTCEDERFKTQMGKLFNKYFKMIKLNIIT